MAARVAMASPVGLRLYCGRRAPPEVLDMIFEFGFNIWLRRRRDITRWEPHANDDGTGRVVYMTTALLVREEQLSAYARKLVWANYQKVVGSWADVAPDCGWDLARPRVIDHDPEHPVEWVDYDGDYELDYGTLPNGWYLTWIVPPD